VIPGNLLDFFEQSRLRFRSRQDCGATDYPAIDNTKNDCLEEEGFDQGRDSPRTDILTVPDLRLGYRKLSPNGIFARLQPFSSPTAIRPLLHSPLM
jgi:hypothetical protein